MFLPCLSFRSFVLFVVLFCGLVVSVINPAMALTISPTIIIIEGKNRYADVALINTSDVVQDYEVSWKFLSMEEGTGKYKESGASTTPFDLTKNMVFTPKRVRLEPKSMQKVRLGLRIKGEAPPPGDYRAHLELREAAVSPDQAKPASKGTSVGIKINVGFSIPVVYRVGASDVTAEIGDVVLGVNPVTSKIEASVPIQLSESPYGVLGHLYVYYNNKLIGEVGNANIFAETHKRTFTVPLKSDKLSGGSLKVVFMDYRKDQNRTYAQKIIEVGK